ncbi:MAG: hypothetical protein V4724_38125 [Pseudomonadota bacterium]
MGAAQQALQDVCAPWPPELLTIRPQALGGARDTQLQRLATGGGYDLICLSMHLPGTLEHLLTNSLVHRIVYATTPPLLLYRQGARPLSRSTDFKRILVSLDGCAIAEQALPYVHAWASQYQSVVTLLSVPAGDGDAGSALAWAGQAPTT